jgi:hypothetical protein
MEIPPESTTKSPETLKNGLFGSMSIALIAEPSSASQVIPWRPAGGEIDSSSVQPPKAECPILAILHPRSNVRDASPEYWKQCAQISFIDAGMQID